MNGHCSVMDTVSNAHVWIYKNNSFYNGTDKDYGGDNNESGSLVMPFLKQMATMHPDFNFSGIKMASSCAQAFHRHPGDSRYDRCIKQIKELQDKGATIGGVLMMYGFIEGQNKESVDSIVIKTGLLINNIRFDVGNNNLPVIFGRYEENGDKIRCPTYHNYDSLLICKIDSIPLLIKNTALSPYKPVPSNMYCDNHHYDENGYKLWANDAVQMIDEYGFNLWVVKNANNN